MKNDEKQAVDLENNPGAEKEPQAPDKKEGEVEVDWKAEAMKYQRLLKKEQKKNLSSETDDDTKEDEEPQAKPKRDDIEERVELRLRGYSKDEITDISAIAKAKKISLLEASELPLVSKGIQALRTDKKVVEQSPAPSNRIAVYKGKTYKEVISDPNSTAADKQAAYEAMMGRRGLNQSV